jgi:hypothetical protein
LRTKALPISVRAGNSSHRHPSPARQPHRSNPFAVWLGTLIIALLPVALILPLFGAAAVPAPTLVVSPDTTTAGSIVLVTGTGFPARTNGQLSFDGAAEGFPRFRTDTAGRFALELTVPHQAAIGDHMVAAVVKGHRRSLSSTGAHPTAVLHVISAAPTGAPVPAPTATQTAAPTLAPTSTPAPTATPTAAPTGAPVPAPTATPTAAPTAAPTATPGPTPTPAAHHAPDPLACTGYPEPRVFLEAQGWWKGNGVTSMIGATAPVGAHVHVGTCFPWGQPVAGVVEFDVRIMLHDNPGELYRLRPQVWYEGGHSIQNEVHYGQTFGAGDHTIWQHIAIDTTQIPFDGFQEMRFFTEVRHTDGADQYASTGWHLLLTNGRPVNHYKPDSQAAEFTEGRGWYEGEAAYTNARWEAPALTQPVSGIWSPDVKMTAGSGGASVTFHGLYIDPNFHAGSQGIVVMAGLGKWEGPVAIDTRTLSNGLHRLVLRGDATVADGTNSGLVVIPFIVQN